MQLEQWNVIFKVMSDKWHIGMKCEIQLLLQLFLQWKENDLCMMFIISNHYAIKCLCNILQLEPCNVMFNVTHWYDLWNTIVIAINVSYVKKMICALMFINSNHDGIKYLSNLLQLDPCDGDFWHDATLVWFVKYNCYWYFR